MSVRVKRPVAIHLPRRERRGGDVGRSLADLEGLATAVGETAPQPFDGAKLVLL